MFSIFLKDFINIGGSGIIQRFNKSVNLLLSNIFPEYEWLPWKFVQISKGYWKDMKNQRKFMDWAGKELNYTNKEDWYKVTTEVINFKLKILKFKEILKLGGRSLLSMYNDSPSLLISAVYPEYKWSPWKLHKFPKDYNISQSDKQEIIELLKEKLNIIRKEDWNEVTLEVTKIS